MVLNYTYMYRVMLYVEDEGVKEDDAPESHCSMQA